MLDEIALDKNLNPEELKGMDEKKKNLLLSRTVKGYNNSPEENISRMQFAYLRKKAAAGESFVIVGRCSETVLRDYDTMVSVFILGDKEQKTARIRQRYQLSENSAKKMMEEKDMERKRYHNSFCKGKWGDSRNYDITRSGADG